MKNYIYEDYKVDGLQIVEANKESLAEGVLAKVTGPSFFLDGFSRNGRFYPKKLWENALKKPETNQALERGLMFGCIGHPKDYSLDELLESGKVSHKVTKIYIDKKTGVGMADYEILDTPSGRILNTILRSGSNMYVSTRAFGGFTNETKVKDGKKYKILDENNFIIESIDFVIQPGFLDTNPKLVESIQEDLAILEADEHKVECINGICGLRMNENKEDSKSNVNDKMPAMDKEQLEKLDKDSLIGLLENVINENKILSENRLDLEPSNENQGSGEADGGNDMMVSTKLMTNYVSYVELLTKMVKYNVEYEKYYDQLIEFLDKDLKLSTDDMAKLSEICDEILKEKDVEESIEKVCEKIKELEEKINDDGEKNDDEKEDKEGKDGEDREKEAEKDKSGTVKTPDNKKEESFVDFVLELKTQVVEKEIQVEVEDTAKVEELQSQVLRLKEATMNLTTQLEEAMNKEPEKEVVTETKVEYRIPEDIHETIIKEKQQISKLEETLHQKDIKLTEAVETLAEALKEKDELEEKLNQQISEYNTLEASFEEKQEKDNEIFKEILEDKESELKDLNEEIVQLGETMDEIRSENKKLLETKQKLGSVLFETKAKYYAAFYRLELPLVENLMKNYSNEAQLIEAPDYTPRESRSKTKAKFLENLVR